MPTSPQIKIGLGTLAQAGSFFAVRGRLLVVTRGTAMERWLPELAASLKEAGMGEDQIEVFSGFGINPRVEDMQQAAAGLATGPDAGGAGFEAVLGFGGGSAIDAAKALVHYAGLKAQVFALPSIVGTGSEQTSFAALYQGTGKISLAAPELLPTRVLVDAELYRQAPPEVKNAPAVDCLCQAMESFWAKGATDQSRAYALDCLRLCAETMRKYVMTQDAEAALHMGRASALSGMAINIAKTTASHALSYGLSTRYGISHGQAVALTLPGLFAFNQDAVPELPRMLKALGLHRAEDFRSWFQELLRDVGLKTSIADFDLPDFDAGVLADGVNLERLGNNPKPLGRGDLMALFG
ncbi:MAG: iron-containing alcohol dehydrogenase [Desulfovibrio sp.]|jgi:alcohol dehydrogenase class IV|nr:iron-containing alcohol dehydrogenase [Desulfovibrio sp.]